jgi:leader peptidase (prepilin peptidase)/N-methyltransferase
MLIPSLLWTLVAGIYGSMVGSFLNVIIYRLPRDSLSIHRPKRSFCPACGTSIHWFDNLPIISYFKLRGQCRYCGGRISFQYPLVEILTFCLFALLTFKEIPGILEIGPHRLQNLGIFVVHLCVVSIVVVVTFIDLELQIIPDEITFSGMLIAPFACALMPLLQADSWFFGLLDSLNPHLASFLSSVGGALVGGGTLLLVGVLGKACLKRDALGLGDIKLMFFMGGLFGFEGALIIFFLGCAVGSLIGVPFRLLTKKQEIPFGPFLSFGVLMVVFMKSEILVFILVTWPSLFR